MTTLVVGGAGYIGAHVVADLLRAGKRPLVVDDLSTGVASRVPVPLARIDIREPGSVAQLVPVMQQGGVTEVIHLAAKKDVAESVRDPETYLGGNVAGTAHLLEAMHASGVQRLVFSSTAAVYGEVDGANVTEDAPTRPVNPYGESKLACEHLLGYAASAWGLQATSLRYFNVAGAESQPLADPSELNLASIAVRAGAAGGTVTVHGHDYPTPDGTCIRDYVHVQDVASAHVAALLRMERKPGPRHDVFNLGSGSGASVIEMLSAINAASPERAVRLKMGPRRPGDPVRVVADVSRASAELGWIPRATLAEIASSAWLAVADK